MHAPQVSARSVSAIWLLRSLLAFTLWAAIQMVPSGPCLARMNWDQNMAALGQGTALRRAQAVKILCLAVFGVLRGRGGGCQCSLGLVE